MQAPMEKEGDDIMYDISLDCINFPHVQIL